MSEIANDRNREEVAPCECDQVVLVSVVIPTYNRTDCLLAALDSFLQQDYRTYEIIVVDQSEEISDQKRRFYEANPQIRVHRLDRPNRCYAKNTGVRLAKGEIVLICDDDIVVPRELITKHIKHYEDERVGAGSCRLVEDGQSTTYTTNVLRITPYGRIIQNAHSMTSIDDVGMTNGGNMSFRRQLILDVGLFSERLVGTGIMEEPDVCLRIRKLGHRIFFDATTTVHHYPQVNGNVAEIDTNRAHWFYGYFYNLALYWKTNGRYVELILSVPYVGLLALKQFVKHKLSFSDYLYMVRGYFDGMFDRAQ